MSPYRYDIFELANPILQFNITVKLLEYNGIVQNPESKAKFVNWTTISSFYLNPSRTMGRSRDGKVNHVNSLNKINVGCSLL